jgi:HSP20 family protein
MTQVVIRKLDPAEPDALSMLESMESLFDAIRQRAFGLFEERGSGAGGDLEDWLRAEREFVWVPRAELVDEQDQYRVRVAVPGLEAKDIQVTAMQHSIVVDADVSHNEEKDTEAVSFSELTEKKMFRRFDLPEPIDPDKVQAALDKGILEITAGKAAPAKQTKVAVQSA